MSGAGTWTDQSVLAGFAEPSWDQWWDVGKSWDPNMESYIWQAEPEWYSNQWNQWQQEAIGAPPGLAASKELGEEDGEKPDEDAPDPVALSLLKHLQQQDVPGYENYGSIPSRSPEEEDEEALAGEIQNAVASFLAGEDLEESDEEPRADFSKHAEAQLSAEAASFVPMSGAIEGDESERQENLGPRCEYLVSTLERVGVNIPLADIPTERQTNNFLEYVRQKPLPEKLLEDEDLWESFHREIRATIASSYFNRYCPTLAEVERSFAENLPEGNKDLQAHLILTMCARKASDTYHILPPRLSRQPIIFLAQTPSDFVSFLDPEKDTGDDHLVEADRLALDKACQDDNFRLHHDLRHAANQMREKVPHFRHKPLAEVENLLHVAVGQGKLVAWDDTWRPKHVADDLMSKQEERIQGMTNHQSWANAKWGWPKNRNARWSERAASKGQWEEFRPKELQPEFDVEQSQWPSLAEAVHPPNRSAWIDRPKGFQVWPDETSSISGTSVRTSAHEDVEIASEELAHKILPIMLSFPEGIGLSMLKKEAAAVDLALWERNPVSGQAVRMAPNLSGTPKKEVEEQVTSFQ